VRLIGDILVSGRAMTNDQLEKSLEHKSKSKGHLGTAILEITNVSEQLVLRALSLQHKVPPVGPAELDDIRPDILRLIPVKLAGRHLVIPFRRLGRVLSVAMVNPADLPAVDEISFLTGLQIAPHVALELRIALALGKHYGIEVPPRFAALAEKLDKNKVGLAGRPYTATRAPIPPGAVATATPSGTMPPFSTPPPPPTFTRTGPQRQEQPQSDSGDPWGGADVPVSADTPIVTETFARSAPPPARDPDESALKRLRGGSSSTTPAPYVPVAEPSPLPQPPPRSAAPEHQARTPSGSRFTSTTSGSWMDHDETPSPSDAPDIPTAPTPPPSRPLSTPAAAAVPAAPAGAPAPVAAPAPAPAPAPSPTDVAARLAAAESRDEIADAVLAGTAGLVKRAALFIAQSEGVLGWAARPDPPEELRTFSLSYSEPSLFASLRNTEGFYVGPCPDAPGNRKVLDALGIPGLPNVALVPITLKGKSVLFLLGETDAGGPAPPVPALKRLAAMTAIALEIVLLKNKLRNL
jgi:type II secretion system (T2SS) protein E